MKSKKDILKLILVYSFSAFVIAYNMLGKALFQLNSTQLDRSGDGFKNYFTFAYHYKYGQGLWFEGMQYPYGDSLMYGDAQPALLLPIKVLKVIGLDISNFILGFIQFLPILSIVFAGVLLHKIMRHYKVSEWWNYISVMACLALSPQLHRFNGHFALAYLFCFPWIWYLLVRYKEGTITKVKFGILAAISLLILGFLHPYHLLIGASFLLAWYLVRAISFKNEQAVFVAALLPIALFLAINKFLDPLQDRPNNPYGVWDYKTEVSDLLPFYGWFASLFEGQFSLRSFYTEGYAYLGILIFIVPLLFIVQKIRKVKIDVHNDFLQAAFLMLLFGMGLHLLLTNQEILEVITPLKQFRSIGRFSWIFYYVGFISFSAYFYKWVNRARNDYIKYVLLGFVVLFWIADAYAFGNYFKYYVRQFFAPNTLVENTNLYEAIKETGTEFKDFQAILPLPIPLEGTEKFTTKDDWLVKINTIPLSYQTGLPLFGAYMSRASIPNMLNALSLTASSYAPKEILNDLPYQDKSILVVINKTDLALFQDFLKKAQQLTETNELLIYTLNPKSIKQEKHKPPYNPTHPTNPTNPIHYDSYENGKGLLSIGNQNFKKQGLHVITQNLSIPDTVKTLTTSIWLRIDPDKSNIPLFNIELFDSKGHSVSNLSYRDTDLKRPEVYKNWVQLKVQLDVPESATYLNWSVKAENIFIDHALITAYDHLFQKRLSEDHIIYDHYIAKTE